MLKKACLVWLKRLQSVWQIAHLKQQCFLSFTFYKMQRSCEKIMCISLFIGFVVKIVLYLHFLYTKDDRLWQIKKRNMNDGTIIFLTFLLITLPWNILLLFSFWHKIISCLKLKSVFYSPLAIEQSTVILEKTFWP